MNSNLKDNLIPLPYFKGLAEYASEVKLAISELGSDYSIAVDLPESLEDEIIKAVRKLPRISLIIDDMGRAIPIIPTDAAIEAVRSALNYGMEIHFLDASMPMEREKFRGTDKFADIATDIGIENYSNLLKPYKSEYLDAREKYMALKLKELLENDRKMLFICDFKHYQNILDNLNKPLDCAFGLICDTVTCKVKEDDVWKISPEIPFFMVLYENLRDQMFNRADSLLKLYMDSEINLNLIDVYKYARNLALTDGQMYPDFYNILAAAKHCIDDDYAFNILNRAKSYPFTYNESNCQIEAYINYDLEPLQGQRVLKIEKKLKINIPFANDRKRTSYSGSIFNFERFPEHFQAESEFSNYLKSKYFHLIDSEDYKIEEFQCGINDGIAIRESLRYRFMDKLYVKVSEKINNTSYIVDFGGAASTAIYFDSQNNCVGSATTLGIDRGYCWNCFTMLPDTVDDEMSSLLSKVDIFDSLQSCIKLALEYSNFLYLFSDYPAKLSSMDVDSNKIKKLPLNKIPKELRESMRCFRIKR